MKDPHKQQTLKHSDSKEWRRTEARSPRFHELETWPTGDILMAMLENQSQALHALWGAQLHIGEAVGAACTRLETGAGRLVYLGAGTSGRLGVLDGVELAPTFGWPQERLLFVLAGGAEGQTEAAEGAEDDVDAALRAIAKARLGTDDVVLGIAASGTTPFTVAGIDAARAAGALTIGIANNAPSPLLEAADIGVSLDTGPEILAGSTRLTAGTAQKIALNMFSTALMIGLRKVYAGHMVEMRASNEKLRQRAQRMVCEITQCSSQMAAQALTRSGFEIKPAVLIVEGATAEKAAKLLKQSAGDLAVARHRLRRDQA